MCFLISNFYLVCTPYIYSARLLHSQPPRCPHKKKKKKNPPFDQSLAASNSLNMRSEFGFGCANLP